MTATGEPAAPGAEADASQPGASADTPQPITRLLQQAAAGDAQAVSAICERLYPELRRVAHARLYHQGRADGLHTTELVHECYLRLAHAPGMRLEDRRQFFAYAARTMRHIIIDAARAHGAERRGGGAEHVTLGEAEALEAASLGPSDELLRVGAALQQLEAVDAELAELVEMRYFAGYTEAEIAALRGVTDRTVRRHWDRARSWLYLALRE